MKKFELSMTKDYVKGWGLQDALREIVQNAIDQEVQGKGNKMGIVYEDNTLKVSNKKSILSKKSLLLGKTTKENDDETIGQFGEGLKVALLVLNRLGKKVTIYNYGNREVWTSKFVKSRRYEGEEVLTIFVDTEFVWKKVPNENLTIVIEDISEMDYFELKKRTLYLQDDMGEILNATEYGRILLNPNLKGKIFVNGLYVNTISELEFGYDIKPRHLKIGRDRDLVSEFDILFTTAFMWRENNGTLLQDLINRDCKDVHYLKSTVVDGFFSESRAIMESTYNEFVESYGENTIPVSSQEEFDEVVELYEDAKPVILPNIRKELIVNSDSYKENVEKINKKKSLSKSQKYAIWKSKYAYSLSNSALKELEEILDLKNNVNEKIS